MLPVGNAQQQTFGGYIDGDGGDVGKNEVENMDGAMVMAMDDATAT